MYVCMYIHIYIYMLYISIKLLFKVESRQAPRVRADIPEWPQGTLKLPHPPRHPSFEAEGGRAGGRLSGTTCLTLLV